MAAALNLRSFIPLFLFVCHVQQLCYSQASMCALGPGFVANLSDSVNSDFVLEDGGTFLLPHAFFPCNGEVKSVNMSLQFQGGTFYSTSMTMNLSLWRSNGSDFVQVDDPHMVVYKRPSNYMLSTSSRAVYFSSNTEDVIVSAIAMPFRVTAGDIVGIHLPPMLLSSFVHESVPLAWETSPSSPVLLLTSRFNCWVSVGQRRCYSMGRNGKPFILGEYIPDATDKPLTSAISTIIPTQAASQGPGSGTASEGPGSGAAVALGCLFAVAVVALVLVVGVAAIVILFRHRMLKSGKYSVSQFANPVAVADSESYVTVNGHTETAIYELADGPPVEITGERRQVEDLRYSRLTSSINETHVARVGAQGIADTSYSALPSYGELQRRSQYANSHMKCMTSLEEKKNMSRSDKTDSVYAVCDPCDESEKELYWPPASTMEELYGQLSQKKYQEIPRNSLTVKDLLGEGEFGQVFYGEWLSSFGPVEVAVKVSNNADSEGRVKLLQEAAVMGQFLHPRVVRLHGVVTCDEPNMVVIEYVKNGALMEYLRGIRLPAPTDFSEKLLRFCSEICDGLNYLSKKGFIHRDLAARNILLDKNYHCKIADFGMSRHLDEDSYYITKGGHIPLKWTAPEAILYRKYSTKSDVWSYGMVMYEIWSLGHEPFENFSTQQVVDVFGSGFCLHPPPGCPRGIYSLIVKCWNPDYHKRVDLDHVLAELQVDQETLLSWREEDRSVSPQADVLGAPLEEGENLYRDLQMSYKK